MLFGDISKVDRLVAESRCPQCEYSLKGLRGDSVTCPECGLPCDLAAMVTRRWRGPWHSAPGYVRIQIPLVWITLMIGVTVVVFVYEMIRARTPVATYVTGGLAVLGWLVLLWTLRFMMRGGMAVWLALFTHVLLVGYLVGVVGVFRYAMKAYQWNSAAQGVTAIVLAAVGLGLIALCRRGERFIAERCIRAHLVRQLGSIAAA